MCGILSRGRWLPRTRRWRGLRRLVCRTVRVCRDSAQTAKQFVVQKGGSLRHYQWQAEAQCAVAGIAGMVLALSLFCLPLAPGALLPLCSGFDPAHPATYLHLVALTGMCFGTALMLWRNSPPERSAHIRSALFAALGMSALPWGSDPAISLFPPALAVAAVTKSMLPGMILGHLFGLLMRWRPLKFEDLGIGTERMRR